MSVESDIRALLVTVVGADKAFPDVAELNVAPPYAAYQQVGGETIDFLGREVPSKKNGRFQITVWATTRADASAKALAIEEAFILATAFQARPLGAAVSDSETFTLPGQSTTRLYLSRQDFSVWSDR